MKTRTQNFPEMSQLEWSRNLDIEFSSSCSNSLIENQRSVMKGHAQVVVIGSSTASCTKQAMQLLGLTHGA